MNTTIQPAVFQAIGAQILKKYPLDTVTFKRLWNNKFGATTVVCCVLWDRLEEARQQMPSNHQPKHLLWSLMLLRTYADETDLVKDASGDDGGRVEP